MTDLLERRNVIYLNPAQVTVYNFDSRNETVEAARATGKTSGMLAPRLIRCVMSHPRGFGLFLGCSLKQLFLKTVPNLIQAMEELTGLREGAHFVRGHAPKKLGFDEPLVRPKEWSQCIHFKNGCIVMMASTNVKAAANGLNIDFILADECRFMKESTIMGEILPALRGIVTDHPGFDSEKNHLHRSTMFVSDAPLTRSQGWMRKRKELQTMEVNKKLAAMIKEAKYALEKYGMDITQTDKYKADILKLRCQSNIFFSFSTLENISILGEEFIRDQKRNLSEAQFNTAILNLDKETYDDGYYVCYDPDIHLYESDDLLQLEAASAKYMRKTQTMITDGGKTLRIDGEDIDLSALRKADDCSMDMDILPKEPLRIALDYNSKMSCIVTGQTPSRYNSTALKVLSSFAYIKSDRVEGLMKKWSKYYKPHQATCKDVIFYYDATAEQGGSFAYASEKAEETKFHNIVKKVLKKDGWNVIEVYMSSPMAHNKKYEIINNCFAGVMKPMIRINAENNHYLSTSLENAGVLPGFKKDKTKEKRATAVDADEIDIERELATRTDMSDAFDTLLIGVRQFGSGMFGCIGGVLGG